MRDQALPGTDRDDLQLILDSVMNQMLDGFEEAGAGDMDWGEQHRLRIRHPLALDGPPLGAVLNMPATRMDGDSYCPKVINGSHVASMRMIAVPGHPEASFFQMPTGQSGHPLSSHYDDLHQLWLGGIPSDARGPAGRQAHTGSSIGRVAVALFGQAFEIFQEAITLVIEMLLLLST